MAEPARNYQHDIDPEIRPNLRAIDGGGETDSSRANLHAVPTPSPTATALQDQENSNVIPGPWGDATSNDNLQEAEATPPAPWRNEVSPYGGNRTQKGRRLSGFNARALFRRRGIIGAIATTLLVGGGVGSFWMMLALMPIHVLENLVQKFDTQNTSLTIRAQKVLTNKLVSKATSGDCQMTMIACRFSRPSNSLLTKMNNNGITPLDKDGKPIEKSLWPNARPAEYSFKGGPPIRASDLAATLESDADFRAAFHAAYNPRWVGWADSVATSVYRRFSVSKKNTLGDATSEGELTNTLNEESRGLSQDAQSVASEAAQEGDSLLSKMIKSKLGTVLSKLAQTSKGVGTEAVAGAVCMAADTPRIITSIERDYTMAQVIAYAVPLASGIDSAHADQATANEMTAIGNLWTQTVNGKSAMDSAGMKYALTGDTPTSATSYEKFVPGARALKATGGYLNVVPMNKVDAACNQVTSPVTGAAINLALVAASGETLGTSAAIAASNYIIGSVASWAIQNSLDTLTSLMTPLLKPAMQDVLGAILGNVTTNLAGEDAGNAFVSGMSNFMGQVANKGGNIPLSADQAVQYNQLSQGVQVAYAQEDRATHSPLDPTNNNTFVGSIVDKLVPYVGQMSSLTGFLSSLGTITTDSLSSLFTAKAATVSTAQYTQCNDPTLKQANVAAGMFCNVTYGLPTQYLNTDPNTVLQYMLNNNQIDPQSGDPVAGSDYATYMNDCTDGSIDTIAGCSIADTSDPNAQQKLAMFSLWTMDHRIQRTADGEDTMSTAVATSSATSGSALKGDDYPYKNDTIDQASPLGYLMRECTDFAAWRLNEQSGITNPPFSDKFKGWGDADTWKQDAQAAGYRVDQTPALGSVAWWGPGVTAGGMTAGDVGHVAIVSAINPNDGSLTIEQYNVAINGAGPHEYSQAKIPASDIKNLWYIHAADIGSQST